MKKCVIMLVLLLGTNLAFSADFQPTVLKLNVAEVISYDFSGSTLDIPINVTGTPAGAFFMVYTKDQGAAIGELQNGFLGWHYINKVDTCLYLSNLNQLDIGNDTIVWDGNDNYGNAVPSGEYTYYMWAYDNVNTKVKAFNFSQPIWSNLQILEFAEDGTTLTNPVFYEKNRRWTIGNDPLDNTLLETSNVTPPTDWIISNRPCIDTNDNEYCYYEIGNVDTGLQAIAKYKWVPNGDQELAVEWADDGLAKFTAIQDNEPGVFTDGNYLYTADSNHHVVEADSEFYVFDLEGELITEVDLSMWFSDPLGVANGSNMNGGPNSMAIRSGKMILNCHCSCIKMMVDPFQLIDGDEEDFFQWGNGNGDYLQDKQFEEDAEEPWTCNDYNVAPYPYTVDVESKLFSIYPSYDLGAISFSIMGPDGTGLPYLSFAGDAAGQKYCQMFVDCSSAFDGIYTDGAATGEGGTNFVAYDSIQGIITSKVSVADETAAFSVDQNSPNPFNPSTTINFDISTAENVKIDVFNVAGQKIETITHEFMNAGSHSVTWDASGLSAGLYFYTVRSGDFSKTMKMTLLK
ncbi:T9SS type A sorting domain-containing protein [Candidatus Latescibacterota bacterium]